MGAMTTITGMNHYTVVRITRSGDDLHRL